MSMTKDDASVVASGKLLSGSSVQMKFTPKGDKIDLDISSSDHESIQLRATVGVKVLAKGPGHELVELETTGPTGLVGDECDSRTPGSHQLTTSAVFTGPKSVSQIQTDLEVVKPPRGGGLDLVLTPPGR